MKAISAMVPKSTYQYLKDEVKEGLWTSLGEAVRYYLRKGIESAESFRELQERRAVRITELPDRTYLESLERE